MNCIINFQNTYRMYSFITITGSCSGVKKEDTVSEVTYRVMRMAVNNDIHILKPGQDAFFKAF